jgi:hypothetical protein
MASRKVAGVRLSTLGDSSYEFNAFGWDFHVRKEGSRWVLDAFDSGIRGADAAHVDSTEHETLRGAVEYAAAPVSRP